MTVRVSEVVMVDQQPVGGICRLQSERSSGGRGHAGDRYDETPLRSVLRIRATFRVNMEVKCFGRLIGAEFGDCLLFRHPVQLTPGFAGILEPVRPPMFMVDGGMIV